MDGIGLHTGAACAVRLVPANENTGRIFVRTDLPGHPQVAADLSSVTQTAFATTLAHGQASVSTVEHLLAAMHALGIDNLRIEVQGPELPALDGSSLPWIDLLDRGELSVQKHPVRQVRPTRIVEVRDGDRVMSAAPADHLSLDVSVDYPHPLVGQQSLTFQLGPESFRKELAWARTFGFSTEIEALRREGLILGGSLENAVVYESDRVVNPEGLRAPDEVVRHKTLDIIGDLALLGRPLHARITAVRPGHTLTVALLKALNADSTNLQTTT